MAQATTIAATATTPAARTAQATTIAAAVAAAATPGALRAAPSADLPAASQFSAT